MWIRILDLVFPPRCAGCDQLLRKSQAFCDVCAESLVPIVPPQCTRCGLPFASGVSHECAACAAHSPAYRVARSVYEYGSELKRALLRLKYANRPDLARLLGPLLGPVPDADVIVPVPLHPRQLARREFNQALELARAAWPKHRTDPFALRKIRETSPQAGLDWRSRRENLRGAFEARSDRVRGARVALVDDVMTTGETVQACSKVLRRAGAKEIVVITLARAVP